MPFFQVDDQLHSHLKAQALIDQGVNGVAALGLWTLAGSQSQAQLGDGQVSVGAWRLLGDKRLFNRLARLLVQVGLWEERPDGWQFHDWRDIGYSSGEQVKLRRARLKELKDPAVVEAVKARDGDHCRYCARKVDWKVRNADHGATYDHVIPGLARGPENLVVACRKCNQKKAQRTPEQAGMTLLPPPFGPDSEAAISATPEPAPSQDALEIGPSEPLSGPQRPGNVQTLVQTSGQTLAGPLKAGTRLGAGSGSGPDRSGRGSGEVSWNGPAGRTPSIPLPEGHTGSAFHNWTGPPPTEPPPQCATHHEDLPCRRCTADHYRQEAHP